MSRYTLTHLLDQTLLVELKSLVAQARATTALLIAHLGEVDARRLYAPAGYPSMFEYSVGELRFSEQAAFKRIRVARVARRFPVVYGMLADGRLSLSAIIMLTAYLRPEHGEELLTAAAGQTKAAIERLLAGCFPQPDLPAFAGPVATLMSPFGVSAGTVKFSPAEHAASGIAPPREFGDLQLSPGRVGTTGPVSRAAPQVTQKLAPLAPQRYAVQCTVSLSTYEKLKHAQALLGHSVPSGELAQVLDRALDTLIAHLEQQKFAKTKHPRACRRSDDARHVPAEVKRTVWERDGGQCTFVGENGHRCESRARLEYDHVEAVANGGHATIKGLRLRCRAHNQYAAEQVFGRDFMRTKRGMARREPGATEPRSGLLRVGLTAGSRQADRQRGDKRRQDVAASRVRGGAPLLRATAAAEAVPASATRCSARPGPRPGAWHRRNGRPCRGGVALLCCRP
jgi:hypothetical protein